MGGPALQVALFVAVGLVAVISTAFGGAPTSQIALVGVAALVPTLAAIGSRGLSPAGRERAWEAAAVGVAALGVAWLWVALA
jgi:hypothetical protein